MTDSVTRDEYALLQRDVGGDIVRVIVELKLGYDETARLTCAKFLLPDGYKIVRATDD